MCRSVLLVLFMSRGTSVSDQTVPFMQVLN